MRGPSAISGVDSLGRPRAADSRFAGEHPAMTKVGPGLVHPANSRFRSRPVNDGAWSRGGQPCGVAPTRALFRTGVPFRSAVRK